MVGEGARGRGKAAKPVRSIEVACDLDRVGAGQAGGSGSNPGQGPGPPWTSSLDHPGPSRSHGFRPPNSPRSVSRDGPGGEFLTGIVSWWHRLTSGSCFFRRCRCLLHACHMVTSVVGSRRVVSPAGSYRRSTKGWPRLGWGHRCPLIWLLFVVSPSGADLYHVVCGAWCGVVVVRQQGGVGVAGEDVGGAVLVPVDDAGEGHAAPAGAELDP